MRQIPGKKSLICSYTNEDFIIDQTAYVAKQKSNSSIHYKYALAFFNSNLVFWVFRNENNEFDDLFPKIKSSEIKSLPIVNIGPSAQQPFIEKADEMLRLNKQLQEASGKFTRNLMREFSLATLPGKLQNWHTLTYAEFLKELSKLKVSLTLAQKAEWDDYFTKEQATAQALAKKIESTDKAIDQMVYALYELTDEEIKIVEGN